MQLLYNAGLLGNGLVLVDTPEWVRRYNECLAQMGFEKTALTSFSIDGIGWSPEIAMEKNDNYYMSHGVANTFAIILTPDQRGKEIYFPFHTFDWDMMNHIFEQAGEQIANITAKAGLWLNLDNLVTHFRAPRDLLMVDTVIIRPTTTTGIIAGAKEQRELVSILNEDEDAWRDLRLREEIKASGKKFGDLRYKKLVIRDIPYSNFRSYYIRAFGGAFVFRGFEDGGHILALLDSETNKAHFDGESILPAVDVKVIERLEHEGWLDRGLTRWYQDHLEDLTEKLGYIFVEICCKEYPDADLITMNESQRLGFLEKAISKLPEAYFELERASILIRQGRDISGITLSEEAKHLIMRPAPDIPPSIREVIWKFIAKIGQKDPVTQYAHNKSGFIKEFETWPESRKAWTVRHLLDVQKDLPSEQGRMIFHH
ncbi:hypothetical protein L0Y49_03235 [bacterium]|nr:hypothetical protein [bacterium]